MTNAGKMKNDKNNFSNSFRCKLFRCKLFRRTVRKWARRLLRWRNMKFTVYDLNVWVGMLNTQSIPHRL